MTNNQTRTEQDQSDDADRAQDRALEIADLRAKVAELEDRWRRALADLDNQRKKAARDTQRAIDDERARITGQWLPVVDNLELALEHAQADPAAILPGVKAVLLLAVDLLARLGYPRRDDVGVSFDPALHEAVSVVPNAEVPEGTVVHVVRPGYGDDEQQLRPASVVVASRPD